MKKSKIIWLVAGSLILLAGGIIAYKKISKAVIEKKYGDNNSKEGMTEEKAQSLAVIIKTALSGWTSSYDQELIFNALSEAKNKAELQLIIDKFNLLTSDNLISWLKSDVDNNRAKRLFERLNTTF